MHKRAIGPLTATPCMQSGGTLQFSLQRLSEIEYYMLSKDKIDLNILMGFPSKKCQLFRFFSQRFWHNILRCFDKHIHISKFFFVKLALLYSLKPKSQDMAKIWKNIIYNSCLET
jgi:hypothetical protein